MRLAMLACAILVFAASSPMRAAADRPEVGPCPTVRLFSSAGDKTFALQFSSPEPTTATIDATFETQNAAYTTSLPEVAMVIGLAHDGGHSYFSKPFAIENPATSPFIDARFTIAAPDATIACSFHTIATPFAKLAKDDQKLIEDASTDVPSTPTFAKDLPPPACAKPFVDARVNGVPTMPEVPPIARSEGAVGLTIVRVVLADDGSIVNTSIYRSSGNTQLDAAAKRAAERTRYVPERFRCDAVGGAYPFVAQFFSS